MTIRGIKGKCDPVAHFI